MLGVTKSPYSGFLNYQSGEVCDLRTIFWGHVEFLSKYHDKYEDILKHKRLNDNAKVMKLQGLGRCHAQNRVEELPHKTAQER